MGMGTGGHGKVPFLVVAGSQPRPMEMRMAGGGTPGLMGAGEVGSSWGGGEARTAVGVAAADKLDLGTAAEDSFSDDDPACVE